ncbi:heme ABC transporter, cell surface heme and hemoprotein receptor HmuT [Rhodococcus aetherivorans]|jgi:iron complex transport system substrate-binding protein|uniref:Heme ABC transporter, cell surface heme and hemoprotein receptor HmuT n=1 Tax=Rhodococcus aetherivorans TaxID=191292 RepID=A0ABQ0YP29_9NOCA|nr:ABC transporter substrate-binding protein [Rhodococcus aetherivorans]ETT26931.1 ABC-type transporter, periplasmic subunit [Rhodococcus rhodochrous ATCC 21198]KDE13363.1 ABC transporter substrate-binding protein [Rhodococcus aetherivorans]NGP24531.1 ABC transporter substrate-binding protein [Rhodococcus aetherivorans]GES38316.1 heme ABC transporter, cell surface heme and hemoprotein receptor HmuT [Rhodococcus aetherivorans]
MTRRGLFAFLAAALALVALVAGCSAAPTGGAGTGARTAVVDDPNPRPITEAPAPALPVTVRSVDGAEVTVTDVARIVTADRSGTLAQTVFALGLGDRLVGRSTAGFPAVEQVPNVTPGGHGLSAEAILALAPTVVLTDTSVGPLAVQEQLRAAGVPVVFVDPRRTLATVGEQIRFVARALGVPAAGEALAQRTDDEIASARAAVPDDGDRPTVAFLYLRGSAIKMLGGPGSGADALVEALGGRDAGTVAGLTSEFTPITSEAMIASAPDVILIMTESLASVGGPAGLAQLPGVAQTPAGRDGNVVDMADSVLLSFGPDTGRVLAALAAALYPAAPA